MRNMLAFLAAVTLTFLGAGWYLDWFKVRSNPAPAGRRSLSIDINTTKIGEDLQKVEQKIQGTPDANKDKPAGDNSVPGAPAKSSSVLQLPNKNGNPSPASKTPPPTPERTDGAIP